MSQEAIESEGDSQDEFVRQREFLERNIESLRKKVGGLVLPLC